VVIAVHALEFEFEKNVVWRAFKNAYWPALYFVDAQGRIRHHHFGEGEYEQSERILRSRSADLRREYSPAHRILDLALIESGMRNGSP
jgi:hypothetical protein